MSESRRRKPHEENLSAAHLRNRDAGGLVPTGRPFSTPDERSSRGRHRQSDTKEPPAKGKRHYISSETNPYCTFAKTRAVPARCPVREDPPVARARRPFGHLTPHIPRDAVSARQRIDYASCTLLCSTTAVLIDTLLDANSLKHLSKLWWLAGEHLPTPNQQLLHPKPSHLQAQGEV